MLITGERIGALRIEFGAREGKYLAERKYPDIATGRPPLKEGPLKNITLDLDTLEKEYFNEMGYDKDGRPTKKKLQELGLEWLIS